jgi:hypothetical protein
VNWRMAFGEVAYNDCTRRWSTWWSRIITKSVYQDKP